MSLRATLMFLVAIGRIRPSASDSAAGAHEKRIGANSKGQGTGDSVC